MSQQHEAPLLYSASTTRSSSYPKWILVKCSPLPIAIRHSSKPLWVVCITQKNRYEIVLGLPMVPWSPGGDRLIIWFMYGMNILPKNSIAYLEIPDEWLPSYSIPSRIILLLALAQTKLFSLETSQVILFLFIFLFKLNISHCSAKLNLHFFNRERSYIYICYTIILYLNHVY